MPIQTYLSLQTPYWNERKAQLQEALGRLAQVPTVDECRLSIVEVATRAGIRLHVLRSLRTQAGADWSISEEQAGHLYFYEKIYDGYHPSPAEIERAFRLFLFGGARVADR